MGESILFVLVAVAAVVCAARAMSAHRILASALFLAAVSALTAILLYMLGAHQLAAIELSVGAGLVTVLLVYAISVVGNDTMDLSPIVPRTVAGILTGLGGVLLICMALPLLGKTGGPSAAPLSTVLWEQRVLDVWIQMVLIFSGVLGILGLLAEGKPTRLEVRPEMAGRTLAALQTPTNGPAPKPEVREEVHA